MLKELKFVQGAVATKELIPAMTHYRIEQGHVRSYNGRMCLSSPIALDIECTPNAKAMYKAISCCEEATVVSVTPGGKLSVRSGKFRALIDTLQGEALHPQPEGQPVAFDGETLLKAFKVLYPFIGTDASRPFTTGVLLDGSSAYATNNTCLVQYWIGNSFPARLNLPRFAIKEMLRIDEAPTHAQLASDSITFHYTDGRWIRTQLLNTEWPFDIIGKLLDQPSNAQALPKDFFKGLSIIKGQVDGASRVYMVDGQLRTHTNPDEGAAYELDLPCDGLYNIHMLSLLEGVATKADFTPYPGPALFFGPAIRGAIVGMRQ